jgi:hypothetical protein
VWLRSHLNMNPMTQCIGAHALKGKFNFTE